ncbi:MAG: helix-turn-helix domain-containing protein [Bulleidia sp.]
MAEEKRDEIMQEIDPRIAIMREIKMQRIQRHMTQQELSRKTGIIQADISKLENGQSNPSVRTLMRIAEGLDMTLLIEFIEKH